MPTSTVPSFPRHVCGQLSEQLKLNTMQSSFRLVKKYRQLSRGSIIDVIHTMPSQIHRVTMFKLPKAEDQKALIEQYKLLQSTNSKVSNANS